VSRRPHVRPFIILAVYGPVLGVALAWSLLAGTLDGWLAREHLASMLAFGVAVGLIIVTFSAAAERVFVAYARLADRMADIIGPLDWPVILLAATASSVAEECLFRGAVQATLGLVPATLLFAACHLVPDRRFLPWTAFALAAGLVLGVLFEWSGSLAAPIAAHFTVNAINLTLLARRARRKLSPS